MKKNGEFGMNQKNQKQKKFHARIVLHWMHFESCYSFVRGAQIEPYHKQRNILKVCHRICIILPQDFSFKFPLNNNRITWTGV